jgi:antitoxin YefM
VGKPLRLPPAEADPAVVRRRQGISECPADHQVLDLFGAFEELVEPERGFANIPLLPGGTISCTTFGGAAMAITASEARKNLFPLIEQVNDDRQPVEITSKRGDAVLLSRADYDALMETAFLLRVPANARRLLESLAQARAGERDVHELG